MRRIALIVILSSAFGTCLTYSVVQPIIPMLAQHYAAYGGERIAQYAAITPSIGMLFAGLVAGPLLAVVGRRVLMLVCLVAMGVLGAAGGVLENPWLFLGSRLLLGAFAVFFSTACVTLMAELYEGSARDKVMGALQGTGTFGAVPLMLAAGVVAERIGWRAPFSFFLIFAVPVLILALVSIRPSGSANQEARAAGGVAGALKLWPWYLMVFAFSQLTIIGVTQLPFLLKAEGVVNPGAQAMILSGNALVMGVGAVLAGPLQGRIGEGRTLVLGLLIAGLGNLAVGMVSGAAWISAASIFSYFGCGFLLTLSFTTVLNRTTPVTRGAAVGFVQAAMFVGQFANPLLLGPIIETLGRQEAYAVVGVISTAAPVIVAVLSVLRRRPATASA
jgi:MFS family permease